MTTNIVCRFCNENLIDVNHWKNHSQSKKHLSKSFEFCTGIYTVRVLVSEWGLVGKGGVDALSRYIGKAKFNMMKIINSLLYIKTKLIVWVGCELDPHIDDDGLEGETFFSISSAPFFKTQNAVGNGFYKKIKKKSNE